MSDASKPGVKIASCPSLFLTTEVVKMKDKPLFLCALILMLSLAFTGCSKGPASNGDASGSAQTRSSDSQGTGVAPSTYVPQTRTIQMVTVQTLIGEFANIPGLKSEENDALKPGGPTEGHEVYSWDPSTLTVYQDDTVVLEIHNAQHDPHIFDLPAFNIAQPIKPDGVVRVSFKASKLGTFRFDCGVPAHQPWMQGWLTVLPDSDAG